jgi:cysteinyl-tRNA synthetase
VPLRFYNTLTRRVDEFITREPAKVAMYTCGPTVYDRAHIGNFRTFLFADLLRRYLTYRGYRVYAVMNITDVDDKTIRGAQREGVPLTEYTARYTKMFFDDCAALRILPVDVFPRATEHVPEMVALVQELANRGHAYQTDGSWYFKVDSFPHYGELARLDVQGQRSGDRVASDEYEKEDVRDFALWKGWEPEDGNVFWETAIGKGRPGWHLECSAMSLKYLGKNFDIHAGGADLIFPHHQNEFAQTEGVTGQPLCRFWMHGEFLLVEGSKMSKSLGNFYTLADLEAQGWKSREVRYALMAAHYRQQLNFTLSGLEAARAALERVDACVRNLRLAEGVGGTRDLGEIFARHEADFQTALDDDLNYPNALAALFNLVRDLNSRCSDQSIGSPEAVEALTVLRRLDSVFGFLDVDQAEESDAEIEALIEARNAARKARNWAEADRIRQQLADANVVLEDRAGGTVWHRK